MTTSAHKTPASKPPAVAPEPTAAELKAARKFRLLQRKTDAELVRMYNNNERLKDQLHEDQQLIVQALGTRFPGQKQEEMLTTPDGTVQRKVTNTWLVDGDRVGELEEYFTRAELAGIFEEKHKHKVPDSRMGDLVAYLGKKVKDYVVTVTTYNITRTAQNRCKSDETFCRRLGDVVRVKQDVRISVTPATGGERGEP